MKETLEKAKESGKEVIVYAKDFSSSGHLVMHARVEKFDELGICLNDYYTTVMIPWINIQYIRI